MMRQSAEHAVRQENNLDADGSKSRLNLGRRAPK
jgi:hypothetical protein